jgi:hypothetical protein
MTDGFARTIGWTDFFLNALVDPRALSRGIAAREGNSLAMSFMVPAVVVISDLLSLSLLGEQTGFFYYKVTYGWILLLLLAVLRYVITASLMDLLSQLMGYEGRVGQIIPLLNYSLFPRVLILPLVHIFKTINFAPIFFYMFFSLTLFLWSAFIAIQGVSEMHKTGFGKSLVIFIFPYLFIGIISFFVFVLLLITGIGFISTI